MRSECTTSALYADAPHYIRDFIRSAEYPWELLPRIADAVRELLASPPDGFYEYAEGVLVGEGSVIAPDATIVAPAVIGKRCTVRTGAYVRGSMITGEGCVLGNSCEFKNAILFDSVSVPHFSYVGDSVLGTGVHLGAGAICSNLKSGGGRVTIHGEKEYDTGLRKVGAFLGDLADIGSGCVLNPGTVIGRRTRVYPLTSVRGVYDSDLIVKSSEHAVRLDE